MKLDGYKTSKIQKCYDLMLQLAEQGPLPGPLNNARNQFRAELKRRKEPITDKEATWNPSPRSLSRRKRDERGRRIVYRNVGTT